MCQVCPETFTKLVSSSKVCLFFTSKRLEFHKAATTAAVQDSVLGHCRMGLAMGSHFSQTIAGIVHFEKRA